MGTVPIAYAVVKNTKDMLFNALDFGGLSVWQAVGVAISWSCAAAADAPMRRTIMLNLAWHACRCMRVHSYTISN